MSNNNYLSTISDSVNISDVVVESHILNETIEEINNTEHNSDMEYYDHDNGVIHPGVIIEEQLIDSDQDQFVDSYSDNETVIIDEYEQQQHRLVPYSDTESEDSYFEDTIEPNEIPDIPPKCPICRDFLQNRQPRFIEPCGHFACLGCLKILFKMERSNWNCPSCRLPIVSKQKCKRAFM